MTLCATDFEMIENLSIIDSKSIEYGVIQIQSRSMSDPPLSDMDFKNQMTWVWTTLNDLNILLISDRNDTLDSNFEDSFRALSTIHHQLRCIEGNISTIHLEI